jgi:hypothetical protein
LFGCAAHGPATQSGSSPGRRAIAQGQGFRFFRIHRGRAGHEDDLAAFASSKPYQLPVLADSILERGMSLIGTRYRFGGTSEAGFDCSGFIICSVKKPA